MPKGRHGGGGGESLPASGDRSGDAMGNHEELRTALAAADTLVAKGETDRKIRRRLRSLSRQISDDGGLKKDLKIQLEGIAKTI